jgi:hypothetical protein
MQKTGANKLTEAAKPYTHAMYKYEYCAVKNLQK